MIEGEKLRGQASAVKGQRSKVSGQRSAVKGQGGEAGEEALLTSCPTNRPGARTPDVVLYKTNVEG